MSDPDPNLLVPVGFDSVWSGKERTSSFNRRERATAFLVARAATGSCAGSFRFHEVRGSASAVRSPLWRASPHAAAGRR